MSTRPQGLPPLTSSVLPNVADGLARRVAHKAADAPAAPARTSGSGIDRRMFEAEEEDERPARRVEAVDTVSRRPASRAPRERAETGPTTYTLGQLVEQVQSRQTRRQQVVESGDPDGPEPEIRGHILAAAALGARAK